LQEKFNKRRHYHPETVQLNGINLLEALSTIKLLAGEKENSRRFRFSELTFQRLLLQQHKLQYIFKNRLDQSHQAEFIAFKAEWQWWVNSMLF